MTEFEELVRVIFGDVSDLIDTSPMDRVLTKDERVLVSLLGKVGSLLGETAIFTGTALRDGVPEEMSVVGTVIAEQNGKIFIAIEEAFEVYSYLGWITPDDFEIVTVILKEQKWHH